MSEPSKNGRPNLFEYANKELSQDALISWLIAWAGQMKSLTPEDEELRRCGCRFVRALLNHKRGGNDPVELEDKVRIEIHPQERSIDVLARIDGEHVLLIEDKTGTKDHGKQLQRYYDDVLGGGTKFGKVQERYLHPVYLKTGNQALADDRQVEAIQENTRCSIALNFLNVLKGYEGRNSILLDFRQHLRKWEDKTNSYAEWTRDAGRECKHAWEGLYRCLEDELDTSTRPGSGWGDVHNRARDFLGFWWRPSDKSDLYLQIERPNEPSGKEARLCFKVDPPTEKTQRTARATAEMAVVRTGSGRGCATSGQAQSDEDRQLYDRGVVEGRLDGFRQGGQAGRTRHRQEPEAGRGGVETSY